MIRKKKIIQFCKFVSNFVSNRTGAELEVEPKNEEEKRSGSKICVIVSAASLEKIS